jgi:hypothetical protein
MQSKDVRLLSLAGLGLMLAFAAFLEIHPGVHGDAVCTSIVETGRACLTCGGTRAWRLAMGGDFGRAIRLNPLGFLAGIATYALLFGAASSFISGRLKYATIGVASAGVLMVVALVHLAKGLMTRLIQ